MRSVLFSSKSDEWSTPLDLFKVLDAEFHFTLDPCSTVENHLCDKYYTLLENGLLQDWSKDVVFCNPPYSHIRDWVVKCYSEFKKGSKIVLLIPARVDTSWFHDYIYGRFRIRFMRGRLKFGNSKNSAPFPSMLVYFGL